MSIGIDFGNNHGKERDFETQAAGIRVSLDTPVTAHINAAMPIPRIICKHRHNRMAWWWQLYRMLNVELPGHGEDSTPDLETCVMVAIIMPGKM